MESQNEGELHATQSTNDLAVKEKKDQEPAKEENKGIFASIRDAFNNSVFFKGT